MAIKEKEVLLRNLLDQGETHRMIAQNIFAALSDMDLVFLRHASMRSVKSEHVQEQLGLGCSLETIDALVALSAPSLGEGQRKQQCLSRPSFDLNRVPVKGTGSVNKTASEHYWDQHEMVLISLWHKKVPVDLIAFVLKQEISVVRVRASRLALISFTKTGRKKEDAAFMEKQAEDFSSQIKLAYRVAGQAVPALTVTRLMDLARRGAAKVSKGSVVENAFEPPEEFWDAAVTKAKPSKVLYAAWHREVAVQVQFMRHDIGKFDTLEDLVKASKDRPLKSGQFRKQYLGDVSFWRHLEEGQLVSTASQGTLSTYGQINYKMAEAALDEIVRLCKIGKDEKHYTLVQHLKKKGYAVRPQPHVIPLCRV